MSSQAASYCPARLLAGGGEAELWVVPSELLEFIHPQPGGDLLDGSAGVRQVRRGSPGQERGFVLCLQDVEVEDGRGQPRRFRLVKKFILDLVGEGSVAF